VPVRHEDEKRMRLARRKLHPFSFAQIPFPRPRLLIGAFSPTLFAPRSSPLKVFRFCILIL